MKIILKMEEEELPFELQKYHKSLMKYTWKKTGLIFTKEEFDTIYKRYIFSYNCELCGKKFETSKNRHMEHDHFTGKFRNVVCGKCNLWKKDLKMNNPTGEKFIFKMKSKGTKSGFRFNLQIFRNNKYILRKSSVDIKKLILIRDKFLKENPNILT